MRSSLAATGLPLLLLSLLAGCSGPPPEDTPADGGVGVITDPRDTSYLQNGSLAPGSHIHDYWGGRDRVQVLDADGFSGRSTCNGCDPGTGMEFDGARPAEGAIVPQGTAWVNGTFTLAADGDSQFTRLELWVKTAKDSEPVRWGPIESGVPFSINATQEANDPPHYVLSLWRFTVHAYSDGDTIRVSGRSHWTIEAVRGLPLVPYPPHPDRWNGASELDLLAESRSTELIYQYEAPGLGTTTSCYGGCLGIHILPSGAVVPFDTDHVEARLRVDGGVPAGLGLWFHGADTWAWSKPAGEMGAPGELVYTLPIEGAMADSPYAPQSLWEFEVWLDQPQPAVAAWTGGYTLTVTAFRDAAPA